MPFWQLNKTHVWDPSKCSEFCEELDNTHPIYQWRYLRLVQMLRWQFSSNRRIMHLLNFSIKFWSFWWVWSHISGRLKIFHFLGSSIFVQMSTLNEQISANRKKIKIWRVTYQKMPRNVTKNFPVSKNVYDVFALRYLRFKFFFLKYFFFYIMLAGRFLKIDI